MSPARRGTGGTALVTGGAGFIGSHLVDRLLADGRRVVVVDDLSTGEERRLAPEAELEVLDIVNFEALNGVIAAVRPQAVFHLAAQAMVTVSVEDPWRDCEVNVKGTLNVLQGAREQSAPVVVTSTCAVYGDGAPLPTPETATPAPVAPYGASKWAAESYTGAWSTPESPNAVCRLGNVYGPRQSPHGEAGVVAIFSHALWSGRRPVLFGEGHPTRDYVHVDDVVEALVRACGVPGTFNVSAGAEVSVREVFELLQGAAGVEVEPKLAPLRGGEMERALLDPARAARALDWRAEVPLEAGIPQTYRALVAEFEAAPVGASRP